MNVHDLKQEDFANKIGVTRQRIGNIVNDKNQPNSELLSQICIQYKEINARWLLTGHGDMFNYTYNKDVVNEDQAEYKNYKLEQLKID
ncbi:MAG: helix-turn-helix transcriptional regulator, partial [Bacteroidales bacterium]